MNSRLNNCARIAWNWAMPVIIGLAVFSQLFQPASSVPKEAKLIDVSSITICVLSAIGTHKLSQAAILLMEFIILVGWMIFS